MRVSLLTLLSAASLGLFGCPAEPAWYTTCGDPVCNTYDGPWDDVPLCTDEEEGALCDEDGATCDPVNDCNARLVCATEDPKAQEGGCPISRLEYKRDVHYLGPDEIARLHARLLDLKLATWRYRWDADTDAEQLGFVIDDDPTQPGVRPDHQQVDLYGLTSLALAGLQAQAVELEAARARLEALEAEVAMLRGTNPEPTDGTAQPVVVEPTGPR